MQENVLPTRLGSRLSRSLIAFSAESDKLHDVNLMSVVGEFNPSAYSGLSVIDEIGGDWERFVVAMDLQPIIQAILAEYTLPWTGYHGVAHWA